MLSIRYTLYLLIYCSKLYETNLKFYFSLLKM